MQLLEVLAILYPESSKTTLRSWIKEGRAIVDGVVVKDAKREVAKESKVTLGSKARFAEGGIRILYEDRDIVIIDKPAGLLSVATAFEKGETAHAFLRKKYHNVYVVHRLDQETSGVMLFALSERARDKLKEMFEKHALQRIYFALVEGHLKPQEGTWRSYQYEDANYYVHNSDDPTKGKSAVTHYHVKKHVKHLSLLELTLETGRKNQIRVHCQAAGHPIAGDKKYGSQTEPRSDPGRLCLHAYLLALDHPITGKPLKYTSEVPF